MNTQAAEVLYSSIQDWALVDQDTTVLDVCCGTGSIGISLAKVSRIQVDGSSANPIKSVLVPLS